MYSGVESQSVEIRAEDETTAQPIAQTPLLGFIVGLRFGTNLCLWTLRATAGRGNILAEPLGDYNF